MRCRATACRATRRETAIPSLEWSAPLGRTTIVTTCAFKRIPSERTLSKSLRRRSRCSGLNRRSADLWSGGESAPSLRTPCVEDSSTGLGCHSGPETVSPLALEVARLKSAFHRPAPTPVRIRQSQGSAYSRRERNLQAPAGGCQFVIARREIRAPFGRLVQPVYTAIPPPAHLRDSRHREGRYRVNDLGTLSRSP